MNKFPHLRKALTDMDDLVEAIRTDDVIMLAQSEGERLILVKHDALSEALDRLDEVNDVIVGFDAWLNTTEGGHTLSSYKSVLDGTIARLQQALSGPMEDK